MVRALGLLLSFEQTLNPWLGDMILKSRVQMTEKTNLKSNHGFRTFVTQTESLRNRSFMSTVGQV